VLSPLEAQLLPGLALLALEPQHDLAGRLGLFVEHGLGLSPVPHLLAIAALADSTEPSPISPSLARSVSNLDVSSEASAREKFDIESNQPECFQRAVSFISNWN
jgi:hypothetical protein